jgi:hypothetical protein
METPFTSAMNIINKIVEALDLFLALFPTMLQSF